jgi:hypothetical protein
LFLDRLCDAYSLGGIAMNEINIPDYADLIRACIAKRDGTPIPNGTAEHATMLIEAIDRKSVV